MSNKLVTMQQVRLIIHYLQRGQSGRKIAQELSLSRNTVRLYVDRILGSSLSLDTIQLMNDTDLSDLVFPSLKKYSADERRSDFTGRTDYFLTVSARPTTSCRPELIS